MGELFPKRTILDKVVDNVKSALDDTSTQGDVVTAVNRLSQQIDRLINVVQNPLDEKTGLIPYVLDHSFSNDGNYTFDIFRPNYRLRLYSVVVANYYGYATVNISTVDPTHTILGPSNIQSFETKNYLLEPYIEFQSNQKLKIDVGFLTDLPQHAPLRTIYFSLRGNYIPQ